MRKIRDTRNRKEERKAKKRRLRVSFLSDGVDMAVIAKKERVLGGAGTLATELTKVLKTFAYSYRRCTYAFLNRPFGGSQRCSALRIGPFRNLLKGFQKYHTTTGPFH